MSAAALSPLTDEQRKHFAWLEQPHLKKIMAALKMDRADTARFVGGCVRDSLLGVKPKDYDVATILKPNAVIDALKAAGLSYAPTGIEHGTITAIADHQAVEVTSLRSDISTDGRRATVAFTEDWAVDASRRDFTINAVYLTEEGALYDPVGGFADAKEKKVRFIGDAEERIREDYLRILRFFRFSARFCDTVDAVGLAASSTHKDGISQLSGERVGAEMSAILTLPRAGFALRAMERADVLSKVWEGTANIDAVDRLHDIFANASAPVVLGVLFGADQQGIGSRLRLSNAEKAIRTNALRGAAAIRPKLNGHQLRVMIYRQGKDTFQDALSAAFAFGQIDDRDHARITSLLEEWIPPVFEYSGKDVVAAGVEPGPTIAKVLKAAEAQWIAEDFPEADRAKAIFKSTLADHDR